MTTHSLQIRIAASIALAVTIVADLHSAWTPVLWLMGIGLWAAYFWSDHTERLLSVSNPARAGLAGLVIVLVSAALVRLYRLAEFPLGPFVDEIFTLNSSLLQLEKPFDLFGHTLLISEAWGKDHPNLFLYLNVPILKLFGVTYWSTKLLPVIPGVIACGGLFLIVRRLFERRAALGTALLFAFAHWSIRLSRYGWDVSLMLMMFALALWLLLLAMQSGRALYACFSGIAAGLCLYSYLGARLAVLSLLTFLAWECALRRDRSFYRQTAAFVIGVAAAAYPFFCYYLSDPAAFWARTSEVSIFNNSDLLLAIFKNLGSHALMFHWMGGTFARDNFPGLPMIDPLTGLLLIAGLVILLRKADTFARLIVCTFVLNFAGGVLSISQEGAPYVYRTAAVIIPAFLAVGVGLQWLVQKVGTRWLLIWSAATIGLNLYLYFGLEAKNTAAMRVMGYEQRLIGLEVARDDVPVWLVTPDVPSQIELRPKPGEKYANANPAVVWSTDLRRLAIINFSGRYRAHETVSENFAHPKDMHFVEPAAFKTGPTQMPAKIIFKSSNQEMTQVATRLGASIRYAHNILGEPFLTVGDLPAAQMTR